MLILEKKLAKFGVIPGLERMMQICSALGNPQDKLRVILVGGTNGKGSVTSYISSMLNVAGYKVGSYYSPHLIKYNERIKINGKDISDKEFRKYEKEILYLFKQGYEITLFEALTIIAYKYFSDKKCDYAVMEIGMGGTYDATNIAKEDIAVITNVALDHTDYLGDTIEKIAKDKAGIIKNPNGRVITACSAEALTAIKEQITGTNIMLKTIHNDFFCNVKKASEKETVFDYVGENFYLNLKIPLIGRYQATNAALAVATVEEIGLEEKDIRKGLMKAKNPGRLQIIRKKPLIVIDAAHNVSGIKELAANLDLFDYDKLICVFGVMKDKAWKEMLKILAPKCYLLIANEIKNKRSEKARLLAQEAEKYTKAIAEKNVKKSIKEAKKAAGKKDMILVCGSIYMLGQAIKFIK